jgi:hypothetical protein
MEARSLTSFNAFPFPFAFNLQVSPIKINQNIKFSLFIVKNQNQLTNITFFRAYSFSSVNLQTLKTQLKHLHLNYIKLNK